MENKKNYAVKGKRLERQWLSEKLRQSSLWGGMERRLAGKKERIFFIVGKKLVVALRFSSWND